MSFLTVLVFAAVSLMGAVCALAADNDAAVLNARANDRKILVAYYSSSGNTERIAKFIYEGLEADSFRIEPAQPYTQADLNYNDPDSRVSKEHNDPSLRDVPLTVTTPDDWDSYDIVFLGYPIWWGIAAWPVDSFVSGNDFADKAVVPFCTSASSGVGESAQLLRALSDAGEWMDGTRFSGAATQDEVFEWIRGLQIPVPDSPGSTPAAPIELSPEAPEGIRLDRDEAGNLYLTGIEVGTADNVVTVGEVHSWLAQPNNGHHFEILTANGSKAEDASAAATGMIIQDYDENNKLVSSATVVVRGDVIGTGRISLTQLVRMASAMSGAEPLEGPYLMAGDWTGTGEITLTDLVREAEVLKG